MVAAIERSVGVPIQGGGGVRTAADADELLGLGVDRVIFGTAAVERPEDVAATVSKHGAQHVIAGIDARNGIVATRGWQEDSGRKVRVTFFDITDNSFEWQNEASIDGGKSWTVDTKIHCLRIIG